MNSDTQAAAALLVLPARREGGRRHDRRRPRQRRHGRPLQRLQLAEPARLLGRRLGVHPRHLVHLPEHADHRRAGAARTRRRASRSALHVSTNCARLDAGVARRLLRTQLAQLAATYPERRRRRRPTARTASRGATTRRSRRSSWPTASGSTRTTTTGRRPGSTTGRACSPARACRCGSPIADGTMIDVYQATTQMTDESGQTFPLHDRHAARQRASAAGLLRRVHREHAHRQRRRTRALGRDRRRRRRRATCRSSRREQMLTWLDGRNALVVRRRWRGAATC